MRNFTKLSVLSCLCYCTMNINAQYCTPPPWATGPYTGITNVTLETLNNSSTINDGGAEVYTYWTSVNVPTLTTNNSYNISVSTQIIGTGNNSRVWIDWNQDQDFDDNGEQACTWDNQPQGTLTANFTVPGTATLGTTRMRVYTDMSENQGHITPEPCGYLNYPNHPLMQHGEVEDYDITLSSGTGITEQSSDIMSMEINTISSHNFIIKCNLTKRSDIRLEVYNVLGQRISTLANKALDKGAYSFSFDKSAIDISSDIVFIRLNADNHLITKKLIVF